MYKRQIVFSDIAMPGMQGLQMIAGLRVEHKAVSYTHLDVYKRQVVLAAIIVLRKNATVKVLDVLVPIMAGCYFVMTIVIILLNIGQLPAVFRCV